MIITSNYSIPKCVLVASQLKLIVNFQSVDCVISGKSAIADVDANDAPLFASKEYIFSNILTRGPWFLVVDMQL